MKNKTFTVIGLLQLIYFMMFFGNGVGTINIVINDLGYIVWGVVAALSLILCIISFGKDRNKIAIPLSILSGLEIGFSVFIWLLPSMMGIPF